MKYVFFTLTSLFIFSIALFSQQSVSPKWCGSYEMMEAHFKKHPELKKRFDAYQATQIENLNNQKTAVTDYTIPVVFHVLHQNGIENISDQQIQDQINILNRDYNLQNSDTSVVIPPMKSAIGNVHFTFALAKLDPSGNCTSGITRHYDANTISWQGDYADYLYTWPSSQYLNFYVVKGIASGAAGYAYYPGSFSQDDQMDAIVILQNYVGSIGTSDVSHSRAITHEVGHWFNLAHVWGSTNDPGVACGNDGVSDTPITKGYTSCSSEATSKICNASISENYQNYMDYSYCSVMFTNGQATRMRSAANNSIVGRNNLWSASNLSFTGISPIAPCAPIANFKANRNTVCVGESVVFTDLSNVGTPTSWAWDLPGSNLGVSSVQNPTVTYAAPGSYSVQLIASNAAGSSPISKINYITVLPDPITSFMSESFETATIPNSMWSVRNDAPANINWQTTSLTATTGTNCIYVDESIAPSSTVEIYSPTFNFSAMPNLALTLKWAGSERNSSTTSYDVFSVQFSTNCGTTWSPRLTRSIVTGSLGVSTSVNGGFVPTSSQFRQEVVPLVGVTAGTKVLFKLKFISESGSSNNFYVDDINLTSTTNLKNETPVVNFSIYPIPTRDNIFVSFDLLEQKNVLIEIKDMLGRTIQSSGNSNLNAGHYDHQLTVNDLSKGIYFVTITTDNIAHTQKVIIE